MRYVRVGTFALIKRKSKDDLVIAIKVSTFNLAGNESAGYEEIKCD